MKMKGNINYTICIKVSWHTVNMTKTIRLNPLRIVLSEKDKMTFFFWKKGQVIHYQDSSHQSVVQCVPHEWRNRDHRSLL